MRSLIFLFCFLALGQTLYAPPRNLDSSSNEVEAESADLTVDASVVEKEDDNELPALPEEDLNTENKRVIKPWSRYDPGKKLFGRRRHNKEHEKKRCFYKEIEAELLNGLSEDALEAYNLIKENDLITHSEKHEFLSKWAEKYDVEEKMEIFLEKKAQHREQKRQDTENFLKSLGNQIAKIWEIKDDEEKTIGEQKEEISKIIKESPDGVDRVLHHMFHHYDKKSEYRKRGERRLSRGKRHNHHNQGHKVHIPPPPPKHHHHQDRHYNPY